MADASLDADRERLARVYEAWFAAIPAHDIAFFERVLAPDFVYVDIFGAVTGKRGYIGLVEAVTPDTSLQVGEVSVRHHGALLLAHGRYTVVGSYADGRDIGSHTRFTSAWTRGEGEWQALSHHATRIQDD